MSKIYTSVISNERTELSPWVTLSAKHVMRPHDGSVGVYHSLQQSDYVTMFVERTDGLIPIVKQFRPAIEQVTNEFPGGLLDQQATPLSVAISELYEETGHEVIGEPHLLGCLYPDTGRLENRLWAFFAKASSNVDVDWLPEEGVESILVSRSQLREMICDGDFNHALHVSLIGLALTKGCFSW